MGEGSGVAVSCGVGHRHGSDPMWRRLWCRLEAVALIQPLVWELPHAVGMALKKKKKIVTGSYTQEITIEKTMACECYPLDSISYVSLRTRMFTIFKAPTVYQGALQ